MPKREVGQRERRWILATGLLALLTTGLILAGLPFFVPLEARWGERAVSIRAGSRFEMKRWQFGLGFAYGGRSIRIGGERLSWMVWWK